MQQLIAKASLLFLFIVPAHAANNQFVNYKSCANEMDNYYFSGRWGGENYIDITFKNERVMMPIKIYDNPQINGKPVVELNNAGLFSHGQLVCGWDYINCADTGFFVTTKEKYKMVHFPFDYPAFKEILKRQPNSGKTVYPFMLKETYAFYDITELDKYVTKNRKILQKKGLCD